MSENKAIRNTIFGYKLENYKKKRKLQKYTSQDEQSTFTVSFQVKFESVFLIKFNYSINIHLFSQKLT